MNCRKFGELKTETDGKEQSTQNPDHL